MQEPTYKKVQKVLGKKNDSELRDISSKLLEARRNVTDKVDEAYGKLWRLKDIKNNMDFLRRQTNVMRGKKKGMHCPAMGKHEDTWVCRAKTTPSYWWYRNKDTIYEKKCAGCRWSLGTRKKKIVFKEVFKTRKDPNAI